MDYGSYLFLSCLQTSISYLEIQNSCQGRNTVLFKMIVTPELTFMLYFVHKFCELKTSNSIKWIGFYFSYFFIFKVESSKFASVKDIYM